MVSPLDHFWRVCRGNTLVRQSYLQVAESVRELRTSFKENRVKRPVNSTNKQQERHEEEGRWKRSFFRFVLVFAVPFIFSSIINLSSRKRSEQEYLANVWSRCVVERWEEAFYFIVFSWWKKILTKKILKGYLKRTVTYSLLAVGSIILWSLIDSGFVFVRVVRSVLSFICFCLCVLKLK